MSNMNPIDALKVLEQVTGTVPLVRKDHFLVMEALNVLAQLVQNVSASAPRTENQ